MRLENLGVKMIPETRECSINKEDCIQALESYLRQEVSYQALFNKQILQGIKDRLMFKVKDFGLKYAVKISDNECEKYADEALSRFMDNWKDKEQGMDNRGHRLGKSKFL